MRMDATLDYVCTHVDARVDLALDDAICVGGSITVHTVSYHVRGSIPQTATVTFVQCCVSEDPQTPSGTPVRPVEAVIHTDTHPRSFTTTLFTRGRAPFHILIQAQINAHVVPICVTMARYDDVMNGRAPIRVGDGVELVPLGCAREVQPSAHAINRTRALKGITVTTEIDSQPDDCKAIYDTCCGYHTADVTHHPVDRTGTSTHIERLLAAVERLSLPHEPVGRVDNAGLKAWWRAALPTFVVAVAEPESTKPFMGPTGDRCPWNAIANVARGEFVRANTPRAHMEQFVTAWNTNRELRKYYTVTELRDTSHTPPRLVAVAMPRVQTHQDPDAPSHALFFSPGVWKHPLLWPAALAPMVMPWSDTRALGVWTHSEIVSILELGVANREMALVEHAWRLRSGQTATATSLATHTIYMRGPCAYSDVVHRAAPPPPQ